MIERLATACWASLRGRLILLALVGLLPLFGLAAYQAINARAQALGEARTAVGRQAKDADRDLASSIQSARQLAHAMTANPVLRGDDFVQCAAVLAAQRHLGQRYSAFYLAGRDGKPLCHSDPAAAPAYLADRDDFRRALETRQPAVARPAIDRVAKRAVVSLAQPLLDANGEVQRVLFVDLDLAWIGAAIASALPAHGFVMAFSDDEGRLLYRWPGNEKWFGHLDPNAPIHQALRTQRPLEAFDSVDHEGIARIFAFAPARDLPAGSLLIRVGATGDALTASADREFAIALALLTVVAALALLAVISVSEKFVRAPVLALARAVGLLGQGDLSVRVAESGFRGELAGLAAGFNRMAAALAAQRARAEAVVEAAPDPIVIVDGEGRIVVVNAQTEAVFGYARAELLGQNVELLIPLRLQAAHVAHRAPYQQHPKARMMGADRELLARRKDGSEFAVAVSLSPLATPQGTLIIGTVRDVTERDRAARALRSSSATLAAALASMTDAVCISDGAGRFVEFNDAFASFHRFKNKAECATTLSDYPDILEVFTTNGEAVPREMWAVPRALRGEVAANVEHTLRRKDTGETWDASYSFGPVRDEAGVIVGSVVAGRDITERKRAERRIQAQLQHLNLLDHITRAIGERQDLHSIFQVVVRSLEDSLPIDFGCVCLHDDAANGLRVACVGVKSEALARELTMDEQALIEVDANGLSRCLQGQLVYEPDIGQFRFPFPERLARGGLGSLVMAPLRAESRVFGVLVAARREVQAFSSVECEFLRQLSEHVALAAHQAQLHGALQQAYDELRQTREAMLQEERLRALGQMASGIAHDINNALSPVSLYAESLLETEPNLSERGRGYLQTIQRGVEDVAQTVARMREFYRPREQQLALASVQMNRMVQQVVDLTRARWSDMAQSHGIAIRALTELAPDLPTIMGVESEIREALTNLVFNAVDAMPEGGTLTLRTRLADADSERAAVVVEIADTGIGMDEDTRRRCLEPFFTTKGERGTGLGLAMVFGTVQRHSAEIAIDSAPGAGTTVRLAFSVPAAVQPEPVPPAIPFEAPARLRLLLIDDDPILLKSLGDALQTDGHVIVTAHGGAAGIAAFRASLDGGEPFAAVFTDLGMPHTDGRRVAAAVKEASPATPVILLTGWGQRLVAEGDVPPHVDRVLSKPPRLRELREVLARLCRPEAGA